MMTKAETFAQVWDLDAAFPGGSDSPQFEQFLSELSERINVFGERVRETADLKLLTDELQELQQRLVEAGTFTTCLTAQDQRDKKAMALDSAVRTLIAAYQSALTVFDQRLVSIADEQWEKLMEEDAFAAIRFPLTERRRQAAEKLAPELEMLLTDLAVDGYHGWSELYDTTVGQIEVPFEEEDGKITMLSAGQAHNKLHHHAKQVREKTFAAWENAWAKHADYCGQALNHLGGFRLQTYKHRNWNSVLKEPLDMNRMSEETLSSMWSAVERGRGFLLDVFQKKAELLGVEKLGWTDVEAPIGSAGKKIPYAEGAAMIVEQFSRFSPKMAEFAEMALKGGWVEAEDRPNKRPGGFCAGLPLQKQSRIFMTYEGSMDNVSTLAHELGHAFHSHVMYDLPPLTQDYAMGVAETASTFAETIVSDALLRLADDRETKLALLDDKIGRAVAFLMNIHARFMFETSFYEERRKGTVSVERLNEFMLEAQKKAYHDSLSSYHPHFWASKLHFYITDVPFYNFPYTFGYLFSTGIYSFAAEQGASFEDRYIALLRDTGRMSVEELALKHLQADVTKPEFWERSIAAVKKDAEEFLAL